MIRFNKTVLHTKTIEINYATDLFLHVAAIRVSLVDSNTKVLDLYTQRSINIGTLQRTWTIPFDLFPIDMQTAMNGMTDESIYEWINSNIELTNITFDILRGMENEMGG